MYIHLVNHTNNTNEIIKRFYAGEPVTVAGGKMETNIEELRALKVQRVIFNLPVAGKKLGINLMQK